MEIIKHFELKKNQNKSFQDVWNATGVILRCRATGTLPTVASATVNSHFGNSLAVFL